MSEAQDDLLVFNGINAVTGDYLAKTDASSLAKVIRGETPSDDLKALLTNRKKNDDFARAVIEKDPTKGHLGTIAGIDPKDLQQSGWGVVFALNDSQADAIRQALRPLLELRREQAGGSYEQGGRYREFTGISAYKAGETAKQFADRNGGDVTKPVDPKKMPYYLLIAAGPEFIPFSFQYQLDVQYAVGRIHFDSIEEYARYALGVVAAEIGEVRLPKRAAFFGVRTQGDRSTELSADKLVAPLIDKVVQDKHDWNLQQLIGMDRASRANLLNLLGSAAERPALLFTASHGLQFPKDDPRQRSHQGAILCQDWPGPIRHRGPIPESFYVAGEHIPDSANLQGMVGFFFACFGAGTPMLDDFDYLRLNERQPIAPAPFLAALPQRMLGHPNGSALAVVGHVERAWGFSFSDGKSSQIETFQSTIKQLMEGFPIGAALEFFNQSYAALSSELTMTLSSGKRVTDLDLVNIWSANNDARGYIVIGDPAVRLPLVDTPPVFDRPWNIQAALQPRPQDMAVREVVQRDQKRWDSLVERAFTALTRYSTTRREGRLRFVAALAGVVLPASGAGGSSGSSPSAQAKAPPPAAILTLTSALSGIFPGGWIEQAQLPTNTYGASSANLPGMIWRTTLATESKTTKTMFVETGRTLALHHERLQAAKQRLKRTLATWRTGESASVERWCVQQLEPIIKLRKEPYPADAPEPTPEAMLAYLLRSIDARRVNLVPAESLKQLGALRTTRTYTPQDTALRQRFDELDDSFKTMHFLLVELSQSWEQAARQAPILLSQFTRIMTRRAGAYEPQIDTKKQATRSNRELALDLLALTGINTFAARELPQEAQKEPRMRGGSGDTKVAVWDDQLKEQIDSFVAISDMDWQGNIATDWRESNAVEQSAHQALVALALASRGAWMERFIMAIELAEHIVAQISVPEGQDLALPAAWMFVNEVALGK